MQQILLVEDDRTLAQGIQLALRTDSINITICHTIGEALESIKQNHFDLFLLDINLPDGSGLDLLKTIKKESETPVIMLTANDMEMDIVMGLESGADDYITKPFSLAVLRARVNTQLRRGSSGSSQAIEIDDFYFDFANMDFRRGNEKIELSKTEQKLLRILVENRGNTMSRADLVDRVWTDGAEYVDENALSVTVKRLRDKLGDSSTKPTYLKTVYGIGYTWAVRE